MNSVTVDELIETLDEVLRGVESGESIVITRDGVPVAELRPASRRGVGPRESIARRTGLAHVDPHALRLDLDEVIDSEPFTDRMQG